MENTRVGKRVANLRKRRGLTQAALAARTSYSLDTVKKVEQGRIPPSAAFVGWWHGHWTDSLAGFAKWAGVAV